MKVFSCAILALVGSASAFSAPSAKITTSALRMSDEAMPEPVIAPPPIEMSMSLPFLVRPAALTGELAGDVGFDPFGFAKSKEDLMNYREAEIKHRRLAMLVS